MKRLFSCLLVCVMITCALCPLTAVHAQNEGKTVIDCVGDSITWGSGSTNAIDGKRNQDMNYEGQLAKMLDETCKLSGEGVYTGDEYIIYNDSKPGASLLPDRAKGSISEGGYSSVKEITASFEREDVDIVILMLGTNDSKLTAYEKNGYPYTTKAASNGGTYKVGVWDNTTGGAENFEAAYRELLDIYFNMDSKPFVYVMLPPPAINGNMDRGNYRITDIIMRDEICPLIQSIADSLAKEGKPIAVIDQRSAFPDPDTDEGMAELLTLLADGVHPNQDGYAVMAETIYNALVSNMHHITFSAEGADDPAMIPPEVTVRSGNTVTLRNTRGRLTKGNQPILGWSLTENAKDPDVEDGGVFEIPAGEKEITLYAVFPPSNSALIIIIIAAAVVVLGLVGTGIFVLKNPGKKSE